MVYYVRNGEEKNLAEIEIYWEEGNFDADLQKYHWTLDCHSYFYMKNFLTEFKDRSDYMTDRTFQSFIDDIDEIQNFRGYVKERLVVDRLIDPYNINAPESVNTKSFVSNAAKNLLENFCNKYGFYLVED